MGWLFSIALLVAGLMKDSDAAIIASAIFAIAGSISFALDRTGNHRETKE